MNIKAVSSQTHTDIEGGETLADFIWAARELAANLLRLVRGGGSAQEIPRNAGNLHDAMERYRDVHHCYPSQRQWNQALDVNTAWSEVRSRVSDENNLEDMDEGDRLAFDRTSAISGIRNGMLQVAASMLMHQIPQEAAGQQEFYENFRHLVDLHETSCEYRQQLLVPRGGSERVQAQLQRAAEASKNARTKKRKGPAKPTPIA